MSRSDDSFPSERTRRRDSAFALGKGATLINEFGFKIDGRQCPSMRADGAPAETITCCVHDANHDGLHRDHLGREWADSKEMRIAVWSSMAAWELNAEPPDDDEREFEGDNYETDYNASSPRELMERAYDEKQRLH